MKRLKIDLFKSLITLSIAIFLIIFYGFTQRYSENGRYLLINTTIGYSVIDSRTGIVYRIYDSKGTIEKVNDPIPENMDKSNE